MAILSTFCWKWILVYFCFRFWMQWLNLAYFLHFYIDILLKLSACFFFYIIHFSHIRTPYCLLSLYFSMVMVYTQFWLAGKQGQQKGEENSHKHLYFCLSQDWLWTSVCPEPVLWSLCIIFFCHSAPCHKPSTVGWGETSPCSVARQNCPVEPMSINSALERQWKVILEQSRGLDFLSL